MRIPSVLSLYSLLLPQQLLQFPPVGSNQGFFQVAALELHCDVVVVRADKPVAALKMGNLHDLRFGKVEDILDALRLLVLQIEDYLGLAVVDDSLSILAVLQREEIVEVLCGADRTAAVAPDDFEISSTYSAASRFPPPPMSCQHSSI